MTHLTQSCIQQNVTQPQSPTECTGESATTIAVVGSREDLAATSSWPFHGRCETAMVKPREAVQQFLEEDAAVLKNAVEGSAESAVLPIKRALI